MTSILIQGNSRYFLIVTQRIREEEQEFGDRRIPQPGRFRLKSSRRGSEISRNRDIDEKRTGGSFERDT